IDQSSVSWGLDITNKETFWMRKMTEGETNSQGMASLYAVDPNYEQKNNGPNNFYSLYSDNDRVILPVGKLTNRLGEYQYTYENTIAAKTKEEQDTYNNYVTRLIMGYKYTPEGYGANDSYYVFNQKVISLDDMIESLKDDSYTIPGVEGLQSAIQAFRDAGLDYLLTGSSTDYFEAYGLRFCPAGQIYYVVPIRHFNIPTGLGYYGVVRNNIYDITINSITPPDLAGPYLSAEIHVQPWAQHSQENKIGVSMTEIPFVPVKIYYWSIKTLENIYPLWWAYANNSRPEYAPEYRTMMIPYDREFTTGLGKIDMIPIQYVHSYAFPLGKLPSLTDPESNIFNHYYFQGEANAVFTFHTNICFVNIQGGILNVKDLKGEDVANPNTNILLFPVEFPEDENKNIYGGTYVRYLGKEYIITDTYGTRYKIKDSEYARYYTGTVNGSVNFDGGYQTEPIKAALKQSNGTWTGIGNLNIAVICEPI
ncbi:fimbria major subunit, partial [Parabacteroides sp. OttesenSCG-928-O15]|nr:fimbria major subunit [Parabacteroides sp. OttesenSCG-928-O15]